MTLKGSDKNGTAVVQVVAGMIGFGSPTTGGLVKTHCRVCDDWKTINQIMHEDNYFPSQQPIKDNIINLKQEADWKVVNPNQPYHISKSVDLLGVELVANTVKVPIYGLGRSIAGYQTISPDGRKKFNQGLDKSKCVFGVCGRIEGRVCYIAEGWATSASVHMATGCGCVFALDSNNLPLVCEKLQKKFPDIKFIVAADNDDPGIKAAKKTKLQFAAPEQHKADWNDLRIAEGKDAVIKGLQSFQKVERLFERLDQIKIQPPQWLIDGVLEENSLAIIFGASGVYKTLVAVGMAMCVASGTDYHGSLVKQGAVDYVAGEGNASFSRRIAAWAASNDVSIAGLPFFKTKRGLTLDQDSIDELCDELDQWMEEEATKLDLIIFDTLDRTISGVEDDNSDTKKYLDYCDFLRDRYRCTVLVVAHTGHAAPNRAKGSTKLKDRMDASYQVRTWGDHSIQVVCQKMKDVEPPLPQTFLRVPIDITLDDGEVSNSLVLQLVAQNTDEALSRDRIRTIILSEFAHHNEAGSMRRSDLKSLVSMETSMSQRSVDRYIKQLIDHDIFILASGNLSAGGNYVENDF